MEGRRARVARVVLLTVLLCGFWGLACAGEPEPQGEEPVGEPGSPAEATTEEPGGAEVVGPVAAAADGLGFRLLRGLRDAESGVNTFISPTSVSIAYR